MQITVFGANGNIGYRVVSLLLDEGYAVKAFIHRHSNLPDHPQLTLVRGDIHETADIAPALEGSEAVLSALGSWHTPEKNILSSAMERLIPAMGTAFISRIITVTGAGALSNQDSPSVFDTLQHAMLNGVAPKILRDGEEHIRLLQESNLDWTIIRSPVMTNWGSEEYSLGERAPKPWQTIHRDAVAHCLVEQLSDSTYLHASPFITRN